MLSKSKLRLWAYRLRVRAKKSLSWDTFLDVFQIFLKISVWWLKHHPNWHF
jgi:hypothetical protein